MLQGPLLLSNINSDLMDCYGINGISYGGADVLDTLLKAFNKMYGKTVL